MAVQYYETLKARILAGEEILEPLPVCFWKGEPVENLSRETLIEAVRHLLRRQEMMGHTIEALIAALAEIRPRS